MPWRHKIAVPYTSILLDVNIFSSLVAKMALTARQKDFSTIENERLNLRAETINIPRYGVSFTHGIIPPWQDVISEQVLLKQFPLRIQHGFEQFIVKSRVHKIFSTMLKRC